MTFCLHELSLDQKLQEKARQEIDQTLARHGGTMTFESLSEMAFLEQCIYGKTRRIFS